MEKRRRAVPVKGASGRTKKRQATRRSPATRTGKGAKGRPPVLPQAPAVDEDLSALLRAAAPRLVERLMEEIEKGDTRALVYALDHALGKPGKATKPEVEWQAPEVVRVEVPKDGGQ